MSTPHFTISQQQTSRDVVRICLLGEFDRAVGDTLADTLRDAARRGVAQVLVDLQHTTFIDSHAVAGLVNGYETAVAVGVRFTVVNGRGLVQQVLDITGLSEILCGTDTAG